MFHACCCKLKIMVPCIWRARAAIKEAYKLLWQLATPVTRSCILQGYTAAVMPPSLLHSSNYTVHQPWGGDSVLTTSTALLRRFVQHNRVLSRATKRRCWWKDKNVLWLLFHTNWAPVKRVPLVVAHPRRCIRATDAIRIRPTRRLIYTVL